MVMLYWHHADTTTGNMPWWQWLFQEKVCDWQPRHPAMVCSNEAQLLGNCCNSWILGGVCWFFLFPVFVMMGNIICQGLVPFPSWVRNLDTPRLKLSFGHSAKNAFVWVGKFQWAQGSLIPQLVPLLTRKVIPGTSKAPVWGSAESLSPLHCIYQYPSEKNTVRYFNYMTQPKITFLVQVDGVVSVGFVRLMIWS